MNAPSVYEIVLVFMVVSALLGCAMSSFIREDGSAWFLLGLLSIGGTILGTIVVELILASPIGVLRTLGAIALGLVWLWFWTHLRIFRGVGRFLHSLGTLVSSLANRTEAQRKAAAAELATIEARLTQLKNDPAYAAAMREVESYLEPYARLETK